MNQYKRMSIILLIFQMIFVLLTIYIVVLSSGVAHLAPGGKAPMVIIWLGTVSVIFLLTGSALAFLSKNRLLFYMHLVIGFLPLMLFLSFIVFG